MNKKIELLRKKKKKRERDLQRKKRKKRVVRKKKRKRESCQEKRESCQRKKERVVRKSRARTAASHTAVFRVLSAVSALSRAHAEERRRRGVVGSCRRLNKGTFAEAPANACARCCIEWWWSWLTGTGTGWDYRLLRCVPVGDGEMSKGKNFRVSNPPKLHVPQLGSQQ